MKNKKLYTFLNLHLFEGEGAGSGAAASGSAAGSPTAPAAQGKAERNPLANVQYGKQAQATPEPAEPAAQNNAPADKTNNPATTDVEQQRKAEFERLIKGEYKDLFDERTQKIINTRFKENKALEEQANRAKALDPVLDLLSSKYGVDSADVENLVKAIQEDNSYYEDEAAEKGLTVEQLKHIKKIERENAEFKRAVEEQKRRADADKIYAEWQQQSEECQRTYANFNLQAECANEETGKRFLNLLKSGVDVKTAYEVVHKDELIGGAMQYTAQTIQQKTVNDIRARGMRPTENGASGNSAAVITKTDPKTFTKKDRAEIVRRVRLGERIEL